MGALESAGKGNEACDPARQLCELKEIIDQQKSEYVFINTAENLRDTSFQKIRVAGEGESFRIIGDAPDKWGLKYKEVEDKQGTRFYVCVNDGNNVSVEKNFLPDVQELFQHPDSEKRSIIFLADNSPRLSHFINPETYRNSSFTLQNARGQQMDVAYKNGDWRIMKGGEVTENRALIWQGKNVISGVQEMRNPSPTLPLPKDRSSSSFEERGLRGDSGGQQNVPSSEDKNLESVDKRNTPEQASSEEQMQNETENKKKIQQLFEQSGNPLDSITLHVDPDNTRIEHLIDPMKYRHLSFLLQDSQGRYFQIGEKNGKWMVMRGSEVVHPASFTEGENVLTRVRENFDNWDIDSVTQSGSLFVVHRKITTSSGELKNVQYTSENDLDQKARQWWNARNQQTEESPKREVSNKSEPPPRRMRRKEVIAEEDVPIIEPPDDIDYEPPIGIQMDAGIPEGGKRKEEEPQELEEEGFEQTGPPDDIDYEPPIGIQMDAGIPEGGKRKE